MAIALRVFQKEYTPEKEFAPESPNRESLRRELFALRHQYACDQECAEELIADYERSLWCARAERNTAMNNLSSLEKLLDIEFPGWNQQYEDVPA